MQKHTKHKNQVRIIGGEQRGRKIKFVEADGLRPTADSVRERLFNWLGQDLTGTVVLDLFAGSGALGLEAASRHAQQVVLVENNRRVSITLRQRVQEFGLVEQVCVQTADALAYLTTADNRFDVVFLDPPFAWQQWLQLFNLLQPRLNIGAKVYIEAGELPVFPDYLHVRNTGQSGASKYVLLAAG